MPRKLQRSWIDEYIDWINPCSESPELYHWWTAITVLSAMVKRNVWLVWGDNKLYANLYSILVGPPGIGKGQAMNPCVNLLRNAGVANVMGDRMTMEYVLERMGHLSQSININVGGKKTNLNVPDSSIFIVSPELSVFMGASKLAISALTDLWDSKEFPFVYGTRGSGTTTIKAPYVSFIGGSTQEWLIDSIPPNAIGGGFTRRINFALATRKSKHLSRPRTPNQFRKAELIDDIKTMSTVFGEMKLTPDAFGIHDAVHKDCEPQADTFEDEATLNYRTSRWTNTLKVAMLLSIAEGDSLLVEAKHMQRADALTSAVLKSLPIVFRAIGSNEMLNSSIRIGSFIKSRGFATEREIMRYMVRDCSYEQLTVILQTLINSDIVFYETRNGKYIYKLNPDFEEIY